MRGVRFTKTEASALRDLVASQEPDKVWSAVLRKLDAAADGGQEVGTPVGPLEAALVAASAGKVVPLGPRAGSAYAKASRLATHVHATAEDATTIGRWLSRQSWMREPTTVVAALYKWHEWLARAQATEPGPAAQEGFDVADLAIGPPPSGGRGGQRRRTPGFG